MKNGPVLLSGVAGLIAAAFMMTAHALPITSVSSDTLSGNTYELFHTTRTNISWSDAQAYAVSVGGHLVSITSAAEEALVQSLWGSLSALDFAEVFNNISFGCCQLGVWTGGLTEAQGSNWYWATGEGDYSAWDGTAIGYENWHPNHPDNDGRELFMGYIIQNGKTGWDNHTGDGGFNMRSFVVEYDVPEPGTLGLLGAGLVGLAWRRRRA